MNSMPQNQLQYQHNARIVEDDTIEKLCVLKQQDESTYQCHDYLSIDYQNQLMQSSPEISNDTDSNRSSSSEMTATWRDKICEWYYNIIDYCSYDREMVFICMNCLDRYTMKHRVDTRTYQLVAITTLSIVNKAHGTHGRRRLGVHALIKLSQNAFSEKDILEMERHILETLEWRLFPPTSFSFSVYLLKLLERYREECSSLPLPLPSRNDLHEIKDIARFLTELSVCDYFYAPRNSSSVGMASLLIAIETVNGHGSTPIFPNEFMIHFVQMLEQETSLNALSQEVQDCRERLSRTFVQSGFYREHQQTTPFSSLSPGIVTDDETLTPGTVSTITPSPVCVSGAAAVGAANDSSKKRKNSTAHS